MLKISVIIATYNRCKSLKDVLECLVLQDQDEDFEYEIIVVDNNSKDKTKEYVEKYFPKLDTRLKYIFESKQGKSFALNRGIIEATGEIIAFTDDDVILPHEWLKNIKKYFVFFPNISGLAGKVLPKLICPKPFWLSLNGEYILKGVLSYYDHGDKAFILNNKEKPFLGANMALRSHIFKKYGLFNEEFKKINGFFSGTSMLTEDTEYYYRIKEAGEKILYAPDVIVEHIFDENRMNKSYFKYWYFRTGICAALVNDQKNFKKCIFLPFWLLKSIAKNLIKSVCNYMILNFKKAFYYEIQFYFDLGQIWGYLKKAKNENCNYCS